MMFKKRTLAVAVLGALSASAIAQEANSFFDDATLDLGFRTYYMQGNVEKGNELDKDGDSVESDDSALAQGIRVNFNSGFLYNLIGFDWGLYTGTGLHTDDDKSSWGMLDTGNEDLLKYSAAVKLRLGEIGVAKYGHQFLSYDLYGDSDSRLTPELSKATTFDGSYAGVKYYAAQIKSGSYRSTEKVEDFKAKNGEKHEINTAGVHYGFGPVNVQAAYAQQKDVNRQYYLAGDYFMDLGSVTTTLYANYHNFAAIGYDNDQIGSGDDSVNAWSAKLEMVAGPLSGRVAYAKIGEFDSNMSLAFRGGNENGGTNLLTDIGVYGYMSLDDSDTTSYAVGLSYDFTEMVQGLTVSTAYLASENDEFDSHEYNVVVGYNVPAVKNLWVGGAYATGKDKYKAPAADRDMDHLRLQLRYDFSVL